MPWKIKKTDVDYFVNDLWKDIRPFPLAPDPAAQFAKDCLSVREAQIEAAVLLFLRDRIGNEAFPEPIAVSGTVLIMRRIRGIRLFDLLRHLRAIESEREDGLAAAATEVLLNRCEARLRSVQLELLGLAPLFSLEAYPLEQKLKELLRHFVGILGLNPSSDWLDSLEEFVSYWDSECVTVPFRDATTKNMMVADVIFALPEEDEDIDAEQYQRSVARSLIEENPADYWQGVDIVDFDFSSIVHLTSPEDDPVSLRCHEWTYRESRLDPRDFLLSPSLGTPSADRLAATFVVRYLRFGGRKLAYKLIGPQGFKIRFAYDNPLFYFSHIPTLCRTLSPEFSERFEPLLSVIHGIYDAAGHPSAGDLAASSLDSLRTYYPELRHDCYWQQNPYRP